MRAKEFIKKENILNTKLTLENGRSVYLAQVLEAYAREVIENAYSNCEAQDEFRQQLLKTIES